ncbi:hypothetical protein INT47_009483 [Mucor saturninus]|uniref:Uncharacterized protein n=1 Tax=Mucor saturninus TaxID=64648 RepID=A0A8H7QT61_9FUNG|nr:hypothetical protein INT47_009483 [Mucor saturninus]
MDQSRSSSVPLIHIDDDDDSSARLTRSSFSLSSIQQPWHSTTEQIPLQQSEEEEEEEEEEDDSSCSSSDDETSIAIPGRKTIISNQVNNLLHPDIPMLDLSSDILYEDIWIDSPVFHEYLQSLETWLYHYLTWLEKIEQCRQLEIAYSKSIALLYDQTKLMLNEPFYTAEECNNLNWPGDTKSIDEEVWDNQDIRSILRKYYSYTLTHALLFISSHYSLLAGSRFENKGNFDGNYINPPSHDLSIY